MFFVQVMEGQVADAEALRRQWNKWLAELGPRTQGWLGATGGITPGGTFIAAVRFESQDAAARNSALPQQTEWWAETEKCFSTPVVFAETSDVTVLAPGSQEAGFVQMMWARTTDRARVEAIEAEMSPAFMELRPDVLGAYRAWFTNDSFLAVDYFTSEAEARAGEGKQMPSDLKASFGEWMSLLEDVRWFDLPQPWLA